LEVFHGGKLSSEGVVYIYTDAEVVGRNPVVSIDGYYILPSWMGVVTPDFSRQNNALKRNLPLHYIWRKKIFGLEPARNIKIGFLLLDSRGTGFHHWFYEVLPKIRWFQEYKSTTGENPKLILNSPLKEYQIKSLRLLGYDSESWIEHGKEISHIEKLIIPSHPIRLKGNQLQVLPTALDWVGDEILSRLPEKDTEFSNRIYISRADADKRNVLNEQEVMKMLAEYGFESYEPGRLSLEDQARLFSNAEIIVGPHGLAFTNLIFSEGTSLIELFPENGETETYFAASNELDISYEYLTFPPATNGENIRPRDRNFTVDIETLRKFVEHTIHE